MIRLLLGLSGAMGGQTWFAFFVCRDGLFGSVELSKALDCAEEGVLYSVRRKE